MTAREMEAILGILTEANPQSIFMEVAFLESWIESAEGYGKGIPLAMVEAALPFWEEEFNYRPRLPLAPMPRAAWAQIAAAVATAGVAAASLLH